jgi:hypothetical protein
MSTKYINYVDEFGNPVEETEWYCDNGIGKEGRVEGTGRATE